MEKTTRREFLDLVVGATALAAAPGPAWSQRTMPSRAVPTTGEMLPIIGLGSTRPVTEIDQLGRDRVAAILRALVEHGGRVVDTWPRDPDNDRAFGQVMAAPEFDDRLFVTINIAQIGRNAGIAHFHQTLGAYNRASIDLVNVGSLTDLEVQWPNLKEWKETGLARYIGVTAAQSTLYDQLESFLRRETPDFVEINYSVTEREAEQRLLPMLADRGIATLISRPFMNGAYFERLENVPLPDWTAEFDCESWAQFSLLYILANPHVTCVLTETTNPVHMEVNALTAFKPLPDAATRQRMGAYIDAL